MPLQLVNYALFIQIMHSGNHREHRGEKIVKLTFIIACYSLCTPCFIRRILLTNASHLPARSPRGEATGLGACLAISGRSNEPRLAYIRRSGSVYDSLSKLVKERTEERLKTCCFLFIIIMFLCALCG